MANRRFADILLRGLRPSRQGKSDWVTVGISFLLAVTLWLLVTLNTQVYTTTTHYPVKVSNLPQDLQLSNPIPEYLNVQLKGVGIKLLYEQLEVGRDTIYIDFSKYSGHYTASRDLGPIRRVMPEGLTAIGAQPDSISLQYSRKASKRVPVQLKKKIVLPKTYRHSVPLQVFPDSVDVVGPADQLAKLESWNTVSGETQPVYEARDIAIALDTVRPFTVLQKSITVRVKPLPYTEAQMEVPVFPGKMPAEDFYLQLDPKTVKVKFLVPSALYGELSPQSFRIVVEPEDLNPRSTYVIPEVKRVPPGVEIVSLTPSKMSYMIIERAR